MNVNYDFTSISFIIGHQISSHNQIIKTNSKILENRFPFPYSYSIIPHGMSSDGWKEEMRLLLCYGAMDASDNINITRLTHNY